MLNTRQHAGGSRSLPTARNVVAIGETNRNVLDVGANGRIVTKHNSVVANCRDSGSAQRSVRTLVVLALLLPKTAGASPEVALDDMEYLRLHELQDSGLVPVSILSTIGPITEAESQSLSHTAGQPFSGFQLDPIERSFWARPVDRLSSRWSLADDEPRTYSTAARPRQMLGAVELVCEHQEGRPCGNGGYGSVELDSASGYGSWLSAFSRLRAGAATNSQAPVGLEVDRLYANLELGPAQLMLGRDVLVIGPGRHTQLLWGTNAPPLDRVALTLRRLEVPSIPLALGGGYILGRLDGPQRFKNSLVSIARVHVEIADRLCLGMTNLLELGGEGAPHVGLWQFVKEHVSRTGRQQNGGISNRRLGYDATLQLKPLRSTLYTEFVFEDWRAQFRSTLAYDVDYLLGWSTSGLGRDGNYGFVVEFQRTGVRSQEHSVFTSGMTSGGHAVGSPLGPDAISVYASPHWRVHERVTLSPWTELIHIGSDTYVFPETSGIERTSSGLAEIRWRAGLSALATVRDNMWLEAGGFFERVHNEGFQTTARDNAGISLSVNWRPTATSVP